MLSFLIFLPLLFGAVTVFVKGPYVRALSLGFSVIYFAFSSVLFFLFDPNTAELQLVNRANWFPNLGIQYFVAIDGLSFWFVILTAFLLPLCVLASWNLIQKQAHLFYASLFVMTTSIVGSFLALDAILFYVFFESSLIPLFFIIGIWGGQKRMLAGFKFFIYTALGSLFLLAGIVALMSLTAQATGEISASLLDFYKLDLPFVKGDWLSTQNILFLLVFIAFAIKLPFVPFHTWLPLAHVQAPAPGSAFLAGVILKMGAYGFFRFLLPLFPQSTEFFAPFIALLAGMGMVYGALMALAQTNIKKVVAYSSVSHVAYVLLGLFSLNIYGITGGFYQMLTHAIAGASLFLTVGMIYERTGKLNIRDFSGAAKTMPALAIFFVITALSAIALPSTGGFISELLVLLGTWMAKHHLAFAFALSGLVLGASYMLYLIHRVFFGPVSQISQNLKPLSLREKGIIMPFVVLVFIMGIFPNWFLTYSSASLKHLNTQKENYELSVKGSFFSGELKSSALDPGANK